MSKVKNNVHRVACDRCGDTRPYGTDPPGWRVIGPREYNLDYCGSCSDYVASKSEPPAGSTVATVDACEAAYDSGRKDELAAICQWLNDRRLAISGCTERNK